MSSSAWTAPIAPDWATLEAALSPQDCAAFMYMSRTGDIVHYKHTDTRRYLHISAVTGLFFRYEGGRYVETTKEPLFTRSLHETGRIPATGTLPAAQCGAATLELVLALLEADDEGSAFAVLAEGIALLGDAAPPEFLTLAALLRLTSRFNKDGYVDLLGHRVSVTIKGPPEAHTPVRLLLN